MNGTLKSLQKFTASAAETVAIFVIKQWENFLERERKRLLNRKVRRIKKFQIKYSEAKDIMPLGFNYDCLSEDELLQQSDAELGNLMAVCADGKKYLESIDDEIKLRLDAEDPNFVFSVTYYAPRKSMAVKLSKASSEIPKLERDCLILLNILMLYECIKEDDYREYCAPFLNQPYHMTADDYGNRAQTAGEILDEPFILMMMSNLSSAHRQNKIGTARNAFQKLILQEPQNSLLLRLKTEFSSKGVIL